MSQAEVIKIFRKNPNKWFSRKEIAEKFKGKINYNNINHNINKLYKAGDLFKKYKMIKGTVKPFGLYKYRQG